MDIVDSQRTVNSEEDLVFLEDLSPSILAYECAAFLCWAGGMAISKDSGD